MSHPTPRILLIAAAATCLGLLSACSSSAPSPSSVANTPTQQAVATSAAPSVSTAAAAAPVQLTNARVTSSDAMVTVENTSAQPVDLSGWSLQVGSAKAQLPQGVNVQPDQSVTLHTAAGTSTNADVFLGQSGQGLVSQLQPGATVALANPSGGTVSSFMVPTS